MRSADFALGRNTACSSHSTSAGRAGGAAIGRSIGPAFARAQVPDVVHRLVETCLGLRESEAERFIDVVDRVGIDPFRKQVYEGPALGA